MKQINPSDFAYLESYLTKVNKENYGEIPENVLKSLGVENKDANSLKKLLDLIDQYETALQGAGPSKWFIPGTPFSIENCPKHKLFFEAGAKYNERCFMASNRSGKSVSGAFETACHLTGEYPIWWKGKRFDRPINAWAVGSTARSTRDTVQKELIGPVGAWGTGMIPADKLGQYWSLAGVPQGLDMIKVKHVSGGWSTVGFKNYEQDTKAFFGTAMECVTPDVEVLTTTGWTNNPQKGDTILSHENGHYKWTKVLDVYRKQHAGKMYNLRSRNNFDISVTPNHRWWVYNKDTKKSYFTTTEKLTKSEQLIISASSEETVVEEIYDDSLVALAGWLVTDGCISGRNMYLTQSISYNAHKCSIIESLLSNYDVSNWGLVDIPYNKGEGIQRKYPIKGTLRRSLLDNCVTADRVLTIEFINKLSSRQRIILLEACIQGDGMYNESGSWSITSKKKKAMDMFQYLATLCGYRTSIVNNGANTYKLRAKTRDSTRYDYTRVSVDSLDITTFDYDDEVYCPSTSLGTAVFRTNERNVLLSGQCVWLDEEVPSMIYNECLLRTMTTDGIVYVTFTPLLGLTPFVVRFCRQADFLGGAKRMLALEATESELEKKAREDGEDARFANMHTAKALIQAGWDDIPWLTEDKKKAMLDDTPPNLRDARSKGIPAMGSGNVYPIPLEEIIVPPFEIPQHFRRLYALDVGWNRTAALWGAEDPNTGTIYLYDEHYMGEMPPAVHAQAIKNRGPWIYGVIDPASRGRSQIDGQSLMSVYKQMGLKLFPANNEVEGGINNVWNMLSVGKIKVFKTLTNFQKEYMLYRRDDKGKVIKEEDHLMDCYSADTEVLTKGGWKFWPDVNEMDKFATVNLGTDQLEYQEATELVCNQHDGDMVSIKNRSLDFLVTPNHRMVVYPRNKEIPEIVLAKDLKLWDRLKGTCKWTGEDFEAPFGLSQKDWAEFLGWFVSEGHTTSNPRHPGYGYEVGISQSISANPEKCEAIKTLLSKFPFKWNYSASKCAFCCSNKELWTILRPLGNTYHKYVPEEIKNSKSDIIRAFLEAAVAGDGWKQNNSWTYVTTSKRLADDIQELILKIGANSSIRKVAPKPYKIKGRYGTNTRTQYWIYKTTVDNPYLRDSKNESSFSTIHYTGPVYCATVPNGTLIIRRNNRIIVAGNCLRYVINNVKRARSPGSALGTGGSYIGTRRYDI